MRLVTIPLLLLALAACGSDKKAPPATTPPAGSAPAGELPAGHPPLDQLPPGHPPMGGQPPVAPADSGPVTGEAPAGLPVVWDVPTEWTPTRPANLMRIANFTVAENGRTPVEVVISGVSIGGTADQNITRWLKQFDFADEAAARAASDIRQRKSNGLTMTRLDVTGRFGGGMSEHAGGDDYRMLAVVVEGAGAPLFVKLVGPADLVGPHAEDFDTFVETIRPAAE